MIAREVGYVQSEQFLRARPTLRHKSARAQFVGKDDAPECVDEEVVAAPAVGAPLSGPTACLDAATVPRHSPTARAVLAESLLRCTDRIAVRRQSRDDFNGGVEVTGRVPFRSVETHRATGRLEALR